MQDQVQAIARHIPMSPMKVRRLIAPLRGMTAQAALDALRMMPQAAAEPVYKLIRSAMANADEMGLDTGNLYIVQLTANEGPGRMPGRGWRARWGSRGRYRPIRKRSSHITVVLQERLPEQP
ncbi:MAG TPA: 50S ribosomal protein L22 [Anaerolineae bacterium]|nr:50S ribosomal protein L22 [Anaerolineae bacterium]HQK13549.1 50S ribosomal protein L22 [Anaerolineae bacterium]